MGLLPQLRLEPRPVEAHLDVNITLTTVLNFWSLVMVSGPNSKGGLGLRRDEGGGDGCSPG